MSESSSSFGNSRSKSPSNVGLETDAKAEAFPRYAQIKRNYQEEQFLTPDELVAQTDQFMKQFEQLILENRLPDTLFFLDKSARPVAYMFRKLFPAYYPNVKIPNIRYINVGGSGSHMYEKEARPFTGKPDVIKRWYGSHLDQNGTIMVVDEYTHTGEALNHAAAVLSQAFPSAVIEKMSVYSKLPNWYQNTTFLGVEEYSRYDFEQQAIERLNEELGTSYKTRMDVLGTSSNRDHSALFWEFYHELEGSIPFVKTGEHVFTYYRVPAEGVKSMFMGSDARVPVKVNEFLEARAELDDFCEKVIQKRNTGDRV